MHSIKLKGKLFAAGLWWNLHSSKKRKDQQAHIKEKAQSLPEENFNCVVVTKDQFGLGHHDGKLRKLPSLVCALRKLSHPTWLGRFLVEDVNGQLVWWVCAIKNGTPFAEGDEIFISREDAEKRIAEHRSYAEWPHEIFTETVEETNKQLGGLLKPVERLRALEAKRIPSYVYLAAGAVTIAAFLFMYNAYLEKQEREAARIQRQLDAQAAKAKQAALMDNPEKYFKRVWEHAPKPEKVASVCLNEMLSLPMFSSGWKLNSIICSINEASGNVAAQWGHTPAASFTRLPELERASVQLSEDSPSTALSRQPLTITAKRTQSAILPKADATARLYQLTSLATSNLSLSWEKPEQHTEKPPAGKTITFTAPWQKGVWTLSNVPYAFLTSKELPHYLRTIPGLAVTTVSFSRNMWNISGEVYAIK